MKQLPVRVYVKKSFLLWISCLIELLLFLPMWILFKVYALPVRMDPQWMILLPLLSLAGILLRYRCNIRWKQLGGALLLGVSLGALAGGLSIDVLPIAVAGSLCVYLGMNADLKLGRFQAYWTGIGLYFVSAIIFNKIPQLQPSLPLLTWGGSLSVFILLLITNSHHLRDSSFSGDSEPLPQGLRRHNRMFVLLILAAAAALAAGAGRTIGGLAWNTVRQLMMWVSRLFPSSSEPAIQVTEPPPAIPELPQIEAREPGLLEKILNMSLYVLAAFVLGIAAYYALRWLYRNTGGIWNKAIHKLLSILRQQQSPNENQAYRDEEKSIFTWEKTIQSVKQFWSSRIGAGNRRDRWENMQGNRERVRWLYRHWLGTKQENGYEVKSYLTPQETGTDVVRWVEEKNQKRKGGKDSEHTPDILLELYDKVRYGQVEPSEAEIAKVISFKKTK